MTRRTPYTEIGISRVKCACGRLGKYQWNCCALDNKWTVVCAACDIKLNEFLLKLFKIPNRQALMKAYRSRVAGEL